MKNLNEVIFNSMTENEKARAKFMLSQGLDIVAVMKKIYGAKNE